MDTSFEGFECRIWLAFVFIVGVPLALAGVRLWRFTTGMGIGLAVTICCACRAIITIVVARGTDGPLFGPSGSVGGVREYRGRRRSLGHRPYCDRRRRLCRWVCIRHAQLRTVGRHSPYRRARWALDCVRVVLLRPGLLIPTYAVNWVVLALFMIIGVGLILYRQHIGIVSNDSC